MELLLNTTLVCFALVIGSVIYAVVSGARRSENEWSDLQQSERDSNRNHSEVTNPEEEPFIKYAVKSEPPIFYPFSFDKDGDGLDADGMIRPRRPHQRTAPEPECRDREHGFSPADYLHTIDFLSPRSPQEMPLDEDATDAPADPAEPNQ